MTKKLLAAICTLALAAACGGSSGSSTGSGNDKPVDGGTLRVLGGGDIDHMDTASSYYSVAYSLLRAITRQLLSYPDSADEKTGNTVVPDMATGLPKVSADGLTYSLTIRDGVQWDAPTGARQVTGADAVLGFKRLCNPVQPTGAMG